MKAELAVLTDYKGLTVEQFNGLRDRLREKDARIKVIKNRLAKIAVKDTPYEQAISELLSGTTAIATTEGDPSGPAKVLVDFEKEVEVFKFKGAAMAGQAISQNEIEALASMPSREELIAKLMGSMMAPARNWVSVLAQIPRQLVNVLAAVRDQKEKE